MQRLILVFFLLGNLLPAFAASRVTVDQLEAIIHAARGMKDAKVASSISDLELSERISASRIKRIEGDLPGVKAQQALLALADSAEFLDLPAAEKLTLAPPDAKAQASLIHSTIDYLRKTIPKIPDFLATRVTTSFEDTPRKDATLYSHAVFYQPLHFVSVSSREVVNREGREQTEGEGEREKITAAPPVGLTTSGEFGSVLICLGTDAFSGGMIWKRWEASAYGPVAIFQYAVPLQRSHFLLHVPGEKKQRPSAYHGEITVDPANGVIVRATLIAEMKPDDAVSKAQLLVTFEPVEIAGMRYFLASRSVALSTVRNSALTAGHSSGVRADLDLEQIQLNDVRFMNHREFRAEYHILAGETRLSDQSEGVPQPTAHR